MRTLSKLIFFKQTKNETKEQFIKRANKCWKEMKETDIQIRELFEKHAKARESTGQKASLSKECFKKATLTSNSSQPDKSSKADKSINTDKSTKQGFRINNS